MNLPTRIWEDPRLIYSVAVAAIVFLFISIWLFRRAKRSGRQAGLVCLMLSILAHLVLLLLVPFLSSREGGSATADPTADAPVGIDTVTFSTFEDDLLAADASGADEEALVAPLPVSDMDTLLDEATAALPEIEPDEIAMPDPVPESIAQAPSQVADQVSEDLDSALDDMFESQTVIPDAAPDLAQDMIGEMDLEPATAEPEPIAEPATEMVAIVPPTTNQIEAKPVSAKAPPAKVPGGSVSDFANRVGQAKDLALNRTGGNADTEAAVAAALQYLADTQQPDGSWNPATTSGGIERSPLGEHRGGAGSRADTAITGLSLLALIGAGNTHQSGEYSENVFRGLSYLINVQKNDGSLAGRLDGLLRNVQPRNGRAGDV